MEKSLKIHKIRNLEVVLDEDLAAFYGVPTKQFNKAVSRNQERFPEDFSFVLGKQEFLNLKFQNGTSSSHGGRRKPPRVFTEHGAVMAASVLRSEKAVKMSVYVVRAFVAMRRQMQSQEPTSERLKKIEKVLVNHDVELKDLRAKILPLLAPPAKPKTRIGFSAAK